MTIDRAWLLMAVDGEDRQFAGNDGYTDHADIFYSWDSRVPRAHAVEPGDRVVLWDKHRLLGASVVERIEVGDGPKTVYRCKVCQKSSIKRRKNKRPLFRCHNQDCLAEFDDPLSETVKVATFRSLHDAAWVPMLGLLAGDELRRLCEEPRSQHAIRPLRWDLFEAAVQSAGGGLDLGLVDRRAAKAAGHKESLTRVRIGQAQFRKQILLQFGDICALTGPCPRAVLEAGHLYSYAELGEHHAHGGLPLRRDIHALFDRGQLAIHPELLTISVRDDLARYPGYAALDGEKLQVALNGEHQRWLRVHWAQHRSALH